MIRDWLEKRSKQELVDFILEVAQEHPRAHERLTIRAYTKNKWGVQQAQKYIDAVEHDSATGCATGTA